MNTSALRCGPAKPPEEAREGPGGAINVSRVRISDLADTFRHQKCMGRLSLPRGQRLLLFANAPLSAGNKKGCAAIVGCPLAVFELGVGLGFSVRNGCGCFVVLEMCRRSSGNGFFFRGGFVFMSDESFCVIRSMVVMV